MSLGEKKIGLKKREKQVVLQRKKGIKHYRSKNGPKFALFTEEKKYLLLLQGETDWSGTARRLLDGRGIALAEDVLVKFGSKPDVDDIDFVVMPHPDGSPNIVIIRKFAFEFIAAIQFDDGPLVEEWVGRLGGGVSP